jgi:hypothetical protein
MLLHLGHTNIPDSATFPNGLPEALETLVATQASSEGPSSDTDYGGMQLLLGDILYSLAMLTKPQEQGIIVHANLVALVSAVHRGKAPQETGEGKLRTWSKSHLTQVTSQTAPAPLEPMYRAPHPIS